MKHLLAFLFAFVATFAIMTPAHAAIVGNQLKVQEYVYDFAVDGGAVGFIDLADAMKLPVGTKILRVWYSVETAFTSGGSATVAIGDAASGARYLAATAYNNAAYNAGTLAQAAIGTPVAVSSANIGKLGITVATAALTAGKLKLMAEVWMPKQ